MDKDTFHTMRIIKFAVKKVLTDFAKQFPTAQALWNGRFGDVAVVSPYGTRGQAPVDSIIVMMSVNNDDGNRVGIEFDPVSLPASDLEEGEFECGNFMVGAIISFPESGDIVIDAKGGANVIVNAETATINADCQLGGEGGAAIARVGDSVVGGVITTGSDKHTAT